MSSFLKLLFGSLRTSAARVFETQALTEGTVPAPTIQAEPSHEPLIAYLSISFGKDVAVRTRTILFHEYHDHGPEPDTADVGLEVLGMWSRSHWHMIRSLIGMPIRTRTSYIKMLTSPFGHYRLVDRIFR